MIEVWDECNHFLLPLMISLTIKILVTLSVIQKPHQVPFFYIKWREELLSHKWFRSLYVLHFFFWLLNFVKLSCWVYYSVRLTPWELEDSSCSFTVFLVNVLISVSSISYAFLGWGWASEKTCDVFYYVWLVLNRFD